MNLGSNPENSPGSPAALAQAPGKPKVSYPSINFNDDAAKEFLKGFEGKIGDTVTANVTLKVTSLRHDQYGQSVGFDMTDIDDVQTAGAEDPLNPTDADKANDGIDKGGEGDESNMGTEPDAEEKILGYKRPKIKKETPDMSAASLQSP